MTTPADPDPRDRFDAALLPGMRDRLAAAYARFRQAERAAVISLSPGSDRPYRLRDCPGCAAPATEAEPLLQAHGLDLLGCRRCGLVYSRQVMDEAADATRYRESEIDDAAMALRCSEPYLELERARARYYLDRVAEVRPAATSLLEVGCGTGTLLIEARRRGWRCLGIEPGRAAAAKAREQGAPVIDGWFPRDLPADAGRFDVVAALDVLEHFTAPRAHLRELRRHVAATGAILLQVPNWNSLLVQLEGAASSVVAPGHWTYFTPHTLRDMAQSEGLRPLLVETVISELDRIERFPPETIARQLQVLSPELAAKPVDARSLHAAGLGYKIVALFGCV